MADPDGTGFTCGAVADREDEIHLGRIRPGKNIPAFRGETSSRITQHRQFLQGVRVHLPLRLAAGRIGVEPPLTFPGENGFGKNGTSGIARAQKEHVINLVGHGFGPWLDRWSYRPGDGVASGLQQGVSSAISGAQSSVEPPQQSFSRNRVNRRNPSRSAR
ncbi:hypothetical protein D3C86_1524520 [compost metagenome]